MVLSDGDAVFLDEIITADLCCHLRIGSYDALGFPQGTAKAEMLVMTADPPVTMVTIAEETEVIHLHYPFPRLVLCMFFHLSADFLANLA